MLIIKILLFICLAVISFSIVHKITMYSDKNILEAKGTDNKFILKKFRKINSFIARNDKFKPALNKRKVILKRLGNPYNITPTLYYLFKYIPTFCILIYFIVSGKFTFLIIAAMFLTFFFIDITYYFHNKSDNAEILYDLPKIYQILEIQSYANIPLEVSLTEIFDVVKNKRLKLRLIELAAEITIRKDVPSAIDHFVENFNSSELNSFCLAIKQSVISGRNREFLENQGYILEKRRLNNKDKETSNNNVKVAIASIFMFIGIGWLMYYSFGTQIGGGIKSLIQ